MPAVAAVIAVQDIIGGRPQDRIAGPLLVRVVQRNLLVAGSPNIRPDQRDQGVGHNRNTDEDRDGLQNAHVRTL